MSRHQVSCERRTFSFPSHFRFRGIRDLIIFCICQFVADELSIFLPTWHKLETRANIGNNQMKTFDLMWLRFLSNFAFTFSTSLSLSLSNTNLSHTHTYTQTLSYARRHTGAYTNTRAYVNSYILSLSRSSIDVAFFIF